MRLEKADRELWALESGERRVVYTSRDGTQVTVTRTDRICSHDFAVGLVVPGRAEFRPTHVRLLLDLYLKRVSHPQNAKALFGALDQMYLGEDPLAISRAVTELTFPMQLDGCDTNLFHAQLLMLKQEFNYGPRGCKAGKVQPPRESLMRFIRWVASGESQIDDIMAAAGRNHPARVRYAAWDESWLTPLVLACGNKRKRDSSLRSE